jgi:hypothetical protein
MLAAPVSDPMPVIFHAVTVTFENIGEVVVQKDKSGARTSFSVTVAGKRQYAVRMRGEPRYSHCNHATIGDHCLSLWHGY